MPTDPIDQRSSIVRMRTDVDALCARGSRPVGSVGHDAARRHLTSRYAEMGLTPYGEGFELPYVMTGQRFTNLVALATGNGAPDAPPVLIAAHYDTVPGSPGADDNAAAVAIALEVAARLRERPAARPAVIAQFDAEEPPSFHTPAMGSTYFHAHQATAPIHAAIVLDLVGHAVPVPGIEDVIFVTGMESDPELERTIRALPDDMGVRIVTALNRYVGDMSDHHTFRLGRVPYLFLTCGRWPHYHAASDLPDALDWRKIAATADLVEVVVRDVAERSLAGPWEGYDTTATDATTMRAALEPLLERLGVRVETRHDIDRVAAALLHQFRL
ncbi:MAG: M28 family peptidase [Trueperaceae bacterium]|nr:MAG: M28 family peptidase [Trueperaceae bacterium]